MPKNKSTPPLLLVTAWLIVGIPAAWGVYNTVLNAKKLFVTPPPAAGAAKTPAASK